VTGGGGCIPLLALAGKAKVMKGSVNTHAVIQALQTGWQGRYQRGTELRLRQACFPWLKTLEQFDFDFQPSLDRRQIREPAGRVS
jgi:DNA replication protein DnaC